MASFLAKICCKYREREKKKLSIRFVLIRPVIENSKEIAKKFKKLKKTLTASFQAKIGWKMLRKRENKNYRSISFLPDRQDKIPEK